MIRFIREGDFLTAVSEFWTVRHNLAGGGLPDDIRILHASNTNLLARPAGARVDEWFERFEPRPRLVVASEPGRRVVEFSGFLCDPKGRRSAIRFTHRYLYSEYSVRNELTLRCDGGIRAKVVTACALSLAGGLDEYIWGTSDFERFEPPGMARLGPHYNDLWGQVERGKLQQDKRRPWQINVFKRGVEGIGWTGDSRQYAWDDGLFKGKGAYSIAAAGRSTDVTLSPLQQKNPLNCGKKLEFNWYLLMSNRGAACRRKYREVAITTTPFPPDDLMRAWAKSGVDLIRIHDDNDYEGRSDFYWHDGAFPPFRPAKMKEMARYIRLCHSLGMKIIPYFSGAELAPEVKTFCAHGLEWYSTGFPNGHVRYTTTGRVTGVYGALMCQDSPWSQWLTRNIKRTVDTYGFDGYYLDWGAPLPCHNTAHLPGEHNGADGFINMLEDTRRWLGDRVLVTHTGGPTCWLMHHNVADQIVTLEEGKRNVGSRHGIDEFPFSIEFMGSSSVGIVPDVFANESLARGPNFKRGVANLVHLNAIPYVYYFSNTGWKNFGYRDWKGFIADDGIFGLFRKFAKIDFTRYRFLGTRTGQVRVEGRRRDVLCSAYVGKDILAVVSNQTAKSAPGGAAIVHDAAAGRRERFPFGRLRPYEVKIISSRGAR